LGKARDRVRDYAGRAVDGMGDDARAAHGVLFFVIAGVIGLIVLGVLAWAILRPSTPNTRMGRGGAGGALPVGVATVARGDVDIKLNALRTVTPLATVTVGPQGRGQS